jgi:hypothetical protein
METVTIQFKANRKTYIIEFPWRGADNFPKDVRAIYKKYGVEKATNQMFTRPDYHGWISFVI